LLRELPSQGPLFARLSRSTDAARAAEFCRRCKVAKVEGVSLHSYRYAWAERAKSLGYPERFAQEALGHNSQAVHRAYARRARVTLPSLENYEHGTPSASGMPGKADALAPGSASI
jgi:integrase